MKISKSYLLGKPALTHLKARQEVGKKPWFLSMTKGGENMISKKMYLMTLAMFALVLAGVIGVKSVKAVETKNPESPLIQAIVNKFNLNQSEVDNTINEVRQEKQKERQAQMESNLSKAVSDGVITESQKQAILEKHQEMQANQTKNREEMEKWMTDNNLDFSKLSQYQIGLGFGGRGSGFGGRHFGGI